MPDWTYDAAESVQSFMDKGSLLEAFLVLAISAVSVPLLVALHEIGHAVAAVCTNNALREARVGDLDDFTITVRRFRLRLGRHTGSDDPGGYVLYDARTVTPRQTLVIALSGPAANLLGAVVMAGLAIRGEGMGGLILALWSISSLMMAVAALVPTGDPKTPEQWSDGRWIRAAWRARRSTGLTRTPCEDSNASTSIPPPRD